MPFGEKPRSERCSKTAVSTFADAPREVKGVFVARWRERLAMKRVAAVTTKVGQLRTGNDEGVQTLFGQQGTNGMDAWSAIATHGGYEAETEAVFI
jgi:hypothetical protein